MDQLSFLFQAFLGGFLLFLTEELIESAKYSLPTLLVSYGVGIAVFLLVNQRLNRWVTWCLVGSSTAFVASVFRIGIIYKGYVSLLADVNCFATLYLTNMTYLLFALSGCTAGATIALLHKLRIKHSGIIAIALGVLYHFKVASGWWSAEFPAHEILFLGEFLAPTFFILVTYPIGRCWVSGYRRGLGESEERKVTVRTNLNCSFILLLLEEPFELTKQTINSIYNFKKYAFKEDDDLQIICIASDKQSEELPELRELSKSRTFSLYTREDWNLPLEQEQWPGPEILGLFSRAAARVKNEVAIIIEPGKCIKQDKFDSFQHAIRKVQNDNSILVVSHDLKSDNFPLSAIFNDFRVKELGLLQYAGDGFPVIVKRNIFGRLKFSLKLDREHPYKLMAGDIVISKRKYGPDLNHPVKYNVSWLLSIMAYNFQTDKYKTGLNILYEDWIS